MHVYDARYDYQGAFVDRWNTRIKKTRVTLAVLGVLLVAAGGLVMAAPYGMYVFAQAAAGIALIIQGAGHVFSYFDTPEFFRSRDELAPPPERLPELLPLARLCADGLVMHLLRTRLLDTVPDERGARIAAFLRERCAGPIGLDDLATELGLSRSRTSFAVKKLFGESFSRRLQAERVERAQHYLAGSRAHRWRRR